MGHRIVVVMLVFVAALFACKDDSPAPDSGPPAEAAVCAGTGTKDVLESCTMDDECTLCMCRTFGHTKFCTKACSGPADCPNNNCVNNVCSP